MDADEVPCWGIRHARRFTVPVDADAAPPHMEFDRLGSVRLG